MKEEQNGTTAKGLTTGQLPAWTDAVVLKDGPEFPNDTNVELKNIQSATYSLLIADIYGRARTRLMAAAALVGRDTPLARAVRAQEQLARPVLLLLYRRIATAFRRSQAGYYQPRDSVQTAWTMFFRGEVLRLIADSRSLRLLLTAACPGTTAESRVAELQLVRLLDERYRDQAQPAAHVEADDWITRLEISVTRP